MTEIVVWLNVDGGNDSYVRFEVPNDFAADQVDELAKQAAFNLVDWGWYVEEVVE